ncbi:salicylate synthase [Actinoplanes sp. NPDC051475]|uniref:salicylate synthase n=1 Tax=Actinoplanes sp. NPDC051475 TaxID=3157225 RepID=UPI0034500131
MPEQVQYETFEVDSSAGPLMAAAGLVRSGAFDRYMLYENDGRFTVAGGVAAELVADRSGVTLRRAGTTRTEPWSGDGLRTVERLLGGLPVAGWRAYGWAAFELAYLLAGDPVAAGPGTLLHLVVPQAEVTFGPHGVAGRVLVGSGLDDLPAWLGTVPAVDAEDMAARVRPVDIADEPDHYRGAVAAAVRDIRNRKLQKVILSRVVPVDHRVDLLGTYVLGRLRNNPARSFLFDLGDLRAGGFSPEIVLAVSPSGEVHTQPLAGTRAATGEPDVDKRLGSDLLRDPKEIYEHATSVKAAVDELGALCRPGSVAVQDFMAIKHRGSVQHLGSMVGGSLAPGRTSWDALATVFPSITASGIPKAGAYEAIRRYEVQPRGLYAGAVLTAGADGSMDAALVLRSIYQRGGDTWLRAGAGIVEQSSPVREYEETCEKLRSVSEHVVCAEGAALVESGAVAAGSTE